MVTIRDTDHGYNRVLTEVRRISNARVVRVGVTDDPHEGSDLSVAEIAEIHEFGNDHVPQRSFLRAWVDANQASWMGRLKSLILAKFYQATDWEAGFGRYAVKGIQDRIRAHIPPPLAASTVKRKGDTTPLIETEQLINGIIYEVK